MEEIGPGGHKRQRLETTFPPTSQVHRQAHAQHHTAPPTPVPLHNNYPGAPLGPPPPYGPPPSKHFGSEQRPEQQQQQFGQPVYSPNTIRDPTRPFSEGGPNPAFVRRDSAPTTIGGSVRSPDDVQHPGVPRPINTELGHDYSPYQPQPEGYESAPYMGQEGQMNGAYNGIPMSQHEPPHGMIAHGQQIPPGAVMSPYGDPNMPRPGYPPQMYGSIVYGGPPQMQQQLHAQGKRVTRAQQACETCRTRKAKCDEGKPTCSYCKDNQMECKYKDIPPAKADRAQKELLDQVRAVQDSVDELTSRLSEQSKDTGEMIEGLRFDIMSTVERLIAGSQQGILPATFKEEPRSAPEATSAPALADTKLSMSYMNLSGDHESEVGSLIPREIQITHTTGAHRLLRWPSIKMLLQGFPVDENYVMHQEEKKGQIRWYGKGQGPDQYDGSLSASDPGTPASQRSEEGATPPDIWGTELGRPFLSEGRFYGSNHEHSGGLTPDGNLNMDWDVMKRLMQSYLDNIHVMHPFIHKNNLRRMFDRVHTLTNPGASLPVRSSFVKEVINRTDRPMKRKHSSDQQAETGSSSAPNASRQNEQQLERRLSTAIVLLVMALGKICEHTEPLPGPVHVDTRGYSRTSQNLQAPPPPPESPLSVSSVLKDSPRTGTAASPLSTSSGGDARNPLSSNTSAAGGTPQQGHRSMRVGDKNVDVVPGLAYYARAAEILGLMLNNNDLNSAQAFILAGLYTSQMACVIESWGWLQVAGRVCRFLIREKYLQQEDARNPARAEMIRFVFHTCLQLESDILAELDLSDSGLRNERVRYPAGIPAYTDGVKTLSDDTEEITAYYSYQLYLRTTLNHIQAELYPTRTDARVTLKARDFCDEMLRNWKSTLTTSLNWDDDEDPSASINAARLRGKYYGGRYITHRPFLHHALHQMTAASWPAGSFAVADMREVETEPMTAEQRSIFTSCKTCVRAAVRSTTAFDAIISRKRLVVTNIFGTAHAQFGNMLILTATYRSYLSVLIRRDELLRLMKRTIRFLRSLAPISKTLETDANMLAYIQEGLLREAELGTPQPQPQQQFPPPPHMLTASSSYSSGR